jgi:hypothetical protein
MTRLIYTIGDSHAWHGWLNIPNCIRSVSVMTMYDFGRIKQVLVPELKGDYVLCFCLGEVDCRYYVNRRPPYRETIDGLVKEYLDTISINAKVHKNIWIYNIPPPPREQPYMKDYGYPLVGSDEERLAYATYMNRKLRESGYVFLDIYDRFCDSEGYMDMSKSDGYVHIADEKPLVEWIRAHDDH